MKKTVVLAAALAVFLPALAAEDADSGASSRGWLGVYIEDLSKPVMVALDVNQGALVTGVADESPAKEAGIEMGDIVTSVDGSEVTGQADLRQLIRERPDKKVTVVVRRKGKAKSFSVTLASRKKTDDEINVDLDWIPDEALSHVREALKQAGTKEKKTIRIYAGSLDSLRKELDELRKELDDLRQELKKQKGS